MSEAREKARFQTPPGARPVALWAARGGTRFNHRDTEAQLEVIIPQAVPLWSLCLNSVLEPAAEAIHVIVRGDEGFHHHGRDVVAIYLLKKRRGLYLARCKPLRFFAFYPRPLMGRMS